VGYLGRFSVKQRMKAAPTRSTISSKVFLALAVLLLNCPVSAFAKRTAPKPVSPVVWEGVGYRAPLGVEQMGCVQAFELSSGRKLWQTEAYHVLILPGLEEDCQWVFISDMQLQNGKLLVHNERGKSFRLDLKTGQVEGSIRYWLTWFLAGTLLVFAAFFAWIRAGKFRPSNASDS